MPALMLLALVFFGHSTAYAATFLPSDRDWSEAEGWTVYWNAQFEGCFAEQLQAGGTQVLFGMWGKDNRLTIAFRNDTLGFAKKDKSYTLKMRFDGRSSWDSGMTLYDFGGGPLLLGSYGGAAKVRAEIAKAGKLTIQLGKKSLATISLKGSSAAFKTVDACRLAKGEQADAPAVAGKADGKALAEADKLMTEAIASYKTGNYAKAEPLYRQVLAIAEKALGPDHAAVASDLTNLANLLKIKGDLAGAEPLYRRALAIDEKALGPEHPDVAADLYNLALLLQTKGDLAEAEPVYRRALAVDEKALGPEHPNVAVDLNNLAILLKTKGDFASAETLYRRALAIDEKAMGPEHADVARDFNNLANLLSEKGDLAGAEPLHRRALAIHEKALGPEHASVASDLNNLAVLLSDKGDLAGAEPLYRRALAIHEKALGPEHPDVATDLNNLAILLKTKGDLAGAEPLYRRALAVDEKALGPELTSVVRDLNNLANLLSDKGDLTEAEPLYRRALAVDEKALGPEHASVATDLNNLAHLLRDKGDLAGSLGLARRAAEAGHPNRGTYLSVLFATAKEHPAMTSESLEVVQRTMTSEAGIALNSLALRGLAGTGDLAILVRNEQDLAGELIKLESTILTEVSKEPAKRDKAKEEAIRARTVVVSAELVKIREELTRSFPDYAELSRPSALNLAEAQQLLTDDEALVVIDIAGKGQGADYVWAVTRGTAEWKELDTRQGDIADSLARLRTGLDLRESGRAPIDPALAHQLYDKLLGPVESVLVGKAHLIFVLNGAVSSLPPQVLVSKPPMDTDLRSAHWLVRDHAITVLPTVSSMKLQRGQARLAKAGKPFIGYGDPVFDPENEGEVRLAGRGYSAFFRGGSTDIAALKANLARLPGTGKELRAVAQSLGADESEVNLREAASEAAVKKARLADYNIVYFATHGLVAGEVDSIGKAGAEPALALTIPETASDLDDGLLTASEVAGLKLNADWVVLSACNTAAEGKPGAGALSGLARAFFYAGARSLLVSHWAVNDDATAELMSRTFANAAANPKRRQAEALQTAMLSIMNDPKHPEWGDPGYWAPFVLVGEAR